MAYKALYRTYRPQKFSEVIGQNVIVKTLQNAIKNDRVSHAYLFCGPRGTGKTSIARIFAKVLNCANEHDGEPCNNCETCKEISEGVSPDVIEIDAASNNGVDEIRDLKDKVKFLPAGSKYKIYIIDEVHMLSTSAFNALLKTLEEPPKHVIFILATTEPQKVLSTIISRCQRFDFSALNVNELMDALENICVNENIDYDKNALKIIASASEGGLRDAISLLDQAISLSDNRIDEDIASAVTGLVGKEKLIDLANSIEDKNISDCLLTIQELENSGKEVSKIVNSLLGFYRDILLCKSINAMFSDEYVKFAEKIELKKVYYNIDALSNVQSKIRYGSATSIYLEVAIIKMISVSNEELDYNKRIQELEEKINSGTISSSEGGSSIDVEELKKIRILEGKFNNLLTELSKLELPKNLEILHSLQQNLNLESSKNDEYKELNNKLDQSLEDISILKANQQAFRNELNNTKSGEVDEGLLQNKIEDVLKKSKPNVDFDEIKDYIDNKLAGFTPSSNDETEIKDILNRLDKIESNVYKMLAGKLATQPVSKKTKNRINERQISMWNDELVDVEKINNQPISPKTDFMELANTDDEVDEELLVENDKEELVLDKEELVEENVEPKDNEEITDFVEEDNVNLFGETEFESEEETKEDTVEDTSWYNEEKQEEIVDKQEEKEDSNLFSNEESDTEEILPIQDDSLTEENTFVEEDTPVTEEPIVEEAKEESVVEDAKEESSSEVIKETKEEPAEDDLDEYERYDVKVLERIMNDSFCKDYINDRDRLNTAWKHLTTLAPVEKSGVAEMLAEGEIKAVGNHEFVLIYNNAFICNRVMSRKFKKVSLKLLFDILNGEFNYFAITRDVWTEKRAEYASQYFIGIKYPKLKPINDPDLKVNNNENDDEDDMVKKILDTFGTDVTIKKNSEE